MQIVHASFGGAWNSSAGRDNLVKNWGFGACAEDPRTCVSSQGILKSGTPNLVSLTDGSTLARY